MPRPGSPSGPSSRSRRVRSEPCLRAGQLMPRLRNISAISAARVRRSRRSRSSGGSTRSPRSPACQSSTRSSSCARMAPTSSGSAIAREPGRAEQIGGDPLGRDERQHRPLGRQVLEELAREDAQPAAAGARDEEQQGVGGLHRGERLVVRQEAVDAKRCAQPERLGPFADRPCESPRRSGPRPRRAARAGRRAGRATPPGTVVGCGRRRRTRRGGCAARSESACARGPRTRRSRSRSRSRRVGVPAGASDRASSAIVSVTAVSAETRANVRRAIVSSTARLARTLRRS